MGAAFPKGFLQHLDLPDQRALQRVFTGIPANINLESGGPLFSKGGIRIFRATGWHGQAGKRPKEYSKADWAGDAQAYQRWKEEVKTDRLFHHLKGKTVSRQKDVAT